MAAPDEFAPTTESPALVDAIRQEIRTGGPIPFRRFMELALYHPQHGYYSGDRAPMGRHADYVTSPELHPIFGALVGRQAAEMWEALGRPPRFDVVELGPGTGALARDLLRWARARPDFLAALRYRLVERSAPLRERQRRTVAEAEPDPDRAVWEAEETLAPGSVTGCILSNELVDAFPVHLVEVHGGRLQEVYVTWEGGRFRETLGEPSTPELEAYFRWVGVRPAEGNRAEVNLAAPRWMRWAGGLLARGFVLTFDYGYEAAELYAPWRRAGTLLCFYRHAATDDPYRRVGRQDITAHVDFTALTLAGREAGLEPLGLTTQAAFLSALGIGEALRSPGLELEEFFARRRAVADLIDPAGLGRIRVLVQAKGTGPVRLTGLAGPGGR
ncbi:MAG TPA: SAM-dependent methyltransferase [Dehalococcoidia bacterium]